MFLALGTLRLVPVRWGRGAMAAVARAIGPLLPVSNVARRNLALCFADATNAERESILRRMWDNLGRVAGEYMHRDSVWDRSLERRVAEIGRERFVEAARSGETMEIRGERIEIAGAENYVAFFVHPGPALIFSAHMGNWELLHWAVARIGPSLSVVYRRPNNPFIARLIEGPRGGAVEFLPKGLEGAFAAARVMELGGRLGFLVDVKENRGVPIPFFGRPAMTGVTLAKFALRYRAPLFGARVERTGRDRFRIIVDPPIVPQPSGDEEGDVIAVMTAVNARVESWIRSRPDQWLWLHRRWPNQATEEGDGRQKEK